MPNNPTLKSLDARIAELEKIHREEVAARIKAAEEAAPYIAESKRLLKELEEMQGQ